MTKHDPLHFPNLLARYFRTCVSKKEKCFIFQQGTYAGGKKTKFNSLTHSFTSDGAAAELLRDDARGAARGQERPAVVQNKHEARKTILRQRRLRKATEDTETAAPVLPGMQNRYCSRGNTPTFNSNYLSSLLAH